ncbi:MAG: acetoin utilization protein AcuC [Desulfobacterales bacterium]|nr:MAG: acetoin utilization protein AcuC [Desulfobacterales bacterium]
MKNNDKEVLVYSTEFSSHSYGPSHPLKVERLQMAVDLMDAYGLFDSQESSWVEAKTADEQDLRLVHTPEYLEILKAANSGQPPPHAWEYGLGSGDNPVFPGLYDWSLLVTGATLECIRQIRDEDRQIALNIAGGLHHALPSRASGFCYLNDPAIGIAQMVNEGLRVLYLDIDVHHGDGVEAIFYNTDSVLTISLHQHGHTLIPGTGFIEDMGKGAGQGYAVNVPLAPGTDDETYLWSFKEIVSPIVLAYNPDVLVTQLGVDTLATDPLASLNLTLNGFSRLIQEIKSWDRKWVALGGGGYNVMNVARAWAKAWAIIKGLDVPDDLPEAFVRKYQGKQGIDLTLSEPLQKGHGPVSDNIRQTAHSAVAKIKETIFPLLGI